MVPDTPVEKCSIGYKSNILYLRRNYNTSMKGEKRRYVRPAVIRIELDYSISLVMMTSAPPPPPPRRRLGGSKPEDPFASPFSDKPFN